MKIIFFGSDDFAAVSLERLIRSRHSVICCVTQPDKAKGRHLRVEESVIKKTAAQNKLLVLQPAVLKDKGVIDSLRKNAADLFVVIAYGQILPAEVLSIPKIFCVNVHGSLLPKYRGAAPINWAIINGEAATGVSVIKMNTKMDAGEIIAQRKVPIADEDTAVSLRAKMAETGAGLLLETMDAIEKKSFELTPQDPQAVTMAPKLAKDQGHIDWNEKAQDIHNKVRGLLPWPGAFSYFDGKRLKILKTQVIDNETGKFPAGEVMGILKEGLVVAAKDKGLLVKEVHPESSKAMPAKDFISGYKVGLHSRFK